MTKEEILRRFTAANALLTGHFLLSSGRHSEQYLQCALALQHSPAATEYGAAIASHFKQQQIDTVAAPAIGGLIIGYEAARALGVRFIWTERENGVMTLRRGFTVEPDEKILVVEDVITTGGSTRETINALTAADASVVGAASIIDRSDGVADVGVPHISLASLNVESYAPENCPLCAQGVSLFKPGSRKASSK